MAARPIMLSDWLKFQVPGVSIFQKSIVLIFLSTVGIFLTLPTTTVLKYLLMRPKKIFFFIIIDKTGNSRSRFRYLIFENSGNMTNYAVYLPSLLSISTKS
jgi:hypothetical protein